MNCIVLLFVCFAVAVNQTPQPQKPQPQMIKKPEPQKPQQPQQPQIINPNPEAEYTLNTIMLACRNLDLQYDSYLDSERQLFTRMEECSKKEKTARPNDLIELRKKVDDLNRSLLKSKQGRVNVSEEMGDILNKLDRKERNDVIKKLGLEKKVKLYKEVMAFLQKESEQKKKDKKLMFEANVRDGILDAFEKGVVDKKLADEQKKVIYEKSSKIDSIATTIEGMLEDWKLVNDHIKAKNLCKFQIHDLVNATRNNIHQQIVEMRKLIKDVHKQRKKVQKSMVKSVKVTIHELKQLIKDTKNLKKKAIVSKELPSLKLQIKSIKHNSPLKAFEADLEKRESKLSADINTLNKTTTSLTTNSLCNKKPLLWKLTKEKATKLFSRLKELESLMKNKK
ncbi:Uncharacterized protein QTN25_006551 [Entamoeba marina]